MPNLDDIMKMAQNAQAELQRAQEALDKIEVEGVSGGGLVKIRATAKGSVRAVEIDQSLLAPSEKQMLEDLVAAAINDARAKADQAAQQEMAKVTSALPLPVGWLTMMLSLARKESFPTRLLPGLGTLTAPKRTDRSVFSVKLLPRRRTWVPVKR